MALSVQADFGERVRAMRTAAGHSQEDFASRANIDRASFGKLERGAINPSLLTIARIAVALGVTLTELMDGIVLDAEEIKAVPRSARGPKPMTPRRK